MITLDKAQSRRRISEIRALWNAWDPIGVATPDHVDEYDAYLAPTLRLLERDAPDEEIIAYLKWVTLDHMGLSEIPDPLAFTNRLREWFRDNWLGTRVPGT